MGFLQFAELLLLLLAHIKRVGLQGILHTLARIIVSVLFSLMVPELQDGLATAIVVLP
ncbi:hypothetical protein [Cognatishimia sp. F0-27]|uniref:hypothetical protein n=1 Tax=Cognatishimia sp. F0-27 TaxID=2816855 RepID=UPI001D0C4B68|nr:hypothetical protein [Cognatishimia sp. F0-27]